MLTPTGAIIGRFAIPTGTTRKRFGANAITPEAVQKAATVLADLRLRVNGQTTPLAELPQDCRPLSLADAYSIQEAVKGLLSDRLGPPLGWKIGCTTPVMQRYLAIPHPCAGTLYQKTVHAEQLTLAAADYFRLGLECEIAVRLGTDIAQGEHSAASVSPAVAAVMTSVEIVEHRFSDFTQTSVASLIGDDFFSAGCVLGAEHAPVELGDLAQLSGGFRVNGQAGETGSGATILGHPLNALAWLANHCAERGDGLKAGQVISLGSVVKTIYPQAGTQIDAGFEQLSPVRLTVV